MSTAGSDERRVRAVVVDDEPAGRAAVTTFLAEVPSIEVVGEAADAVEAIEVIGRARPDLLFLDIQMPDGDGFGVLEALGDAVPRGVVLVTAHGKYAQRAFDVHAVDYVTKPFGRPRFMAAVARALHRLAAEDALDMRATLRSLVRSLRGDAAGTGEVRIGVAPVSERPTREPRARIGVRLGSRTTLLDVEAIDWIEADGDFARIHAGEQVHLVQTPMRELETTLGASFFRIHRSVIVNLERVGVLHRDPDGGGSVGVKTGVRLRVARARWESLEVVLGLREGSAER